MAFSILGADPKLTRQKTADESQGYNLSVEDMAWVDSVYEKLKTKMKAEVGRVGTMIPYAPENGRYHDLGNQEGQYGWTRGFWPGMLWQMYNATGDEEYRKAAEGVEKRSKSLMENFDHLGHDVGFVYLPMSVANYRLTGNEDSKRDGLKAALVLAARYNPAGHFLRAWNDNPHLGYGLSGWIIVDCLMNLPILYWAAEAGDDPRFKNIAVEHAKTAQKYIVREDGSCNHLLQFDPITGEFLNNPGGQGYGQGSSWSRGQSWAVYGFTLSYKHTGDESFLQTAKKCAHYTITSLATADWLPLVDYRAPAEPVKYDSTAGMITAAGLLELAKCVGEYERRIYVQAAIRILKACEAKFCNWNPDEDSIVDGGTYYYHDETGKETHVPIIYGDYYLIEAILKLKDKDLFIW